MIALYMRLSKADDGLDEGESSCSIESQRLILRDYVARHADLAGREVREFVDDGFSGMSIDRPALTELLGLCRRRKVGVVIVKDMSRLARDYIDAGDLVERVFPLLGVRFISVAESYDTARTRAADGGDGDLLFGFRNIVNASYCASVSAKVKAACRNAWGRGDYTGGVSPFGYVKDASAEGRLRVDPVAAGYVRRVFELAAECATTGEVARALNDEGVPSPGKYAEDGLGRGRGRVRYKDPKWSAANVGQILRQRRYVGDIEAGRSANARIGSGSRFSVPKEDWVVVEGAHDAIVTQEEFEAAQRCLQPSRPKSGRHAVPGLFTGLAYCPECGWEVRTMRRRNGEPYAYCANCGCGHEATIDEDELANALLAALEALADACGIDLAPVWEGPKGVDTAVDADGGMPADELARAQDRAERLHTRRLDLYRRFCAGTVLEDEYELRRVALDADIAEADAEVARLAQASEHTSVPDFAVTCEEPDDAEQGEDAPRRLNRKMVSSLVSRILISADGSVTVEFAFLDPMEEVTCE